MPREHKRRGRREEKKRKRQEYGEPDTSTKRQRYAEPNYDVEIRLDQPGGVEDEPYYNDSTSVAPFHFYGLLDQEEQAYFKRADQMLELNQFADNEERRLFLDSVWREASGKELKIATDHTCSKLLERLISLSTKAQLKELFQAFRGHLLDLVQNRHASHCCEELFMLSAPIVTEELIAPASEDQQGDQHAFESMETLFVSAVDELEDSLGYLMTDQFASHALRVLLVVLSGRPLSAESTTNILKSRKKEKTELGDETRDLLEVELSLRAVPSSFHIALDKIVSRITAGLESHNLRELAKQPLGNPVLQLLLEIEFGRLGKQKTKEESPLLRRMLPEMPPGDGTSSASFIRTLLYHRIGSRLIETIVQHAPGKYFKAVYQEIFRGRLTGIVKNEVAGFVVIKVLERLGAEDLEQAVEELSPEIPTLITHGRFSIVRTLIERCRVRKVDMEPISNGIKAGCGSTDANILARMLDISTSQSDSLEPESKAQMDSQASSKAHASLLAQTMVAAPGPLRDTIQNNLVDLPPPAILSLAKDRSASHLLQASLVTEPQTKPFRRRMAQKLIPSVVELTTDAVASHVVDALWDATLDLTFLRERVAEELVKHEAEIKDSFAGRVVWRNWMMDLYKRKRMTWIARSKPEVEDRDGPNGAGKEKSGIELARERFAAGKARKPWDKGKGVKSGIELARERFAGKRGGHRGGQGMGRNALATGA